MDLRALDYFVSIYETGSLSAASKAKFIAQPSISASLKQLELSLASELFTRHARGVKATTAGEQLYPLAKQLLGQAQAISQLFIDRTSNLPFRLGLTKGLGVERMSKLLKDFTTAIDALELTLVDPEDKCDARIISKDLLRATETFVPMWQEDYQLAMPISHALRLKDSIQLDDLNGMAFIQRSPCEGWNQLSKALQQSNTQLDVRARIQTIEYAKGLVRAGLGCAFIPVLMDGPQETEIIFRPLQGMTLSRDIGLAFSQNSTTVDILTGVVSGK
ncbi:MAG: DNA-binding transcriptional LysR family regulator [Paraglaciecola sp.]|jgi:DNA-binding transcriptional LysR family regulator